MGGVNGQLPWKRAQSIHRDSDPESPQARCHTYFRLLRLLLQGCTVLACNRPSKSLINANPKSPEARKVQVQADNETAVVVVPLAAYKLFLEILAQMANGNAVTLMPVNAELTTQQAADLLNVSRPYVIKLLDENKLPYKKVGTHRRIAASDLFEYKRKSDEESRATLAELTRLAQELEGY